ncbi:S8 family serine peptidase (plasmid) [Kitasatospora sp. NBC_00070]|uniref:S8 family serine peptidase n=1 Tax=Kitasatospora sp. NBC_00070 TaxID=2975962 RepID=UPI00324FA8AE
MPSEQPGSAGSWPAGWGRYLVAPRPAGLVPGSVPPIEESVLLSLLEEDDQVRVLEQVRPSRSRGLGAIAEPAPACPLVAVVVMAPERARALAGNPQVVVEPDLPLLYPVASPLAGAVPIADPALAVLLTEPATMTVQVTDRDQTPVPGAHVWAIGAAGPAHAVTDSAGTATLELVADTPHTVRTVYVRPAGGFWPARIHGPALDRDAQDGVHVTLRALAEDFEGFPHRPLSGWGAQAMRLNQVPPTFRGHGTTIALLDAGVDAAHPDLKDSVVGGHDFTSADGLGWQEDATGHGTQCAGVIAAADNRTGITGIAADAKLHALKLYPNGRVSHLLRALDWCITHGIDIAQINLACPQPSQLVAWKILDTRTAGTTLIAPAGDTHTTAAFPASLPTVISAGALAHTGTQPRDGQAGHHGPYTPAFTPVGADFAAPGVAVVTTGRDSGYTPADGTAIAAAHLTGLAALLAAHHGQLRSTAGRVDILTTLMAAAARPVPGTDPTRTGRGLPDAPTALGQFVPEWQTGTLPSESGVGSPQFMLRT